MFEKVKAVLKNYDQLYRNPNLPRLELSGLYSLHPERQGSIDTPYQWPGPYPNADYAGVYVIFSSDMKLIYVGVASNINSGVSRYFRYSADGNRCCELRDNWDIEPIYIATIGIADKTFFEAYALEQYLIFEFKPPVNKQGKIR